MPGTPATSPRFGAPRYADADTASFSAQVNGVTDVFDDGVPFSSGTLAARPAASVAGRLYYATDTLQFYWDDGMEWCVGPRPKDRGASIISAVESVSTPSGYSLMPTPDRVSGLVLPTNGLVRVRYQALASADTSGGPWCEAAIFLGSNQVEIQGWDNTGAHGPKTQAAYISSASYNPLCSFFGGLVANGSATAFGSDVTTGQIIGFANLAGEIAQFKIGTEYFATSSDFGLEGTFGAMSSDSTGMAYYGGVCEIQAAAGTYDVSVRFHPQSGSVAAKERKLWVEVIPFG